MTKILRRILRDLLSEDELGMISGGYDLIGDIAILRLREGLSPEKRRLVGEALIEAIPSVRSVWNQVTPVSGEHRVRGLEHLAGDRRTVTVHREYGCSYKVDVAGVYFSPRLSGERMRVASSVREGERIHNMFAGVGPFSILIAKTVPRVEVYSSEINPRAYELLVENIAVNKVKGSVLPLLGDAMEHARSLGGMDRVLLPLPEKALEALPLAVEELHARGIVHVYLHVKGDRPSAIKEAMELVASAGPTLCPYFARAVREVAPRLQQVVVDAIKPPSALARCRPGGRRPLSALDIDPVT